MRVNVLHSPFSHWVRGILWEVASFVAFLVVTSLLIAVVVLVF